jgi:ketosteroid isomerase-like protein
MIKMENQIKEIVQKYFKLVNEENFDEFFKLFHPDVEFHAPFNFNAKGIDNVMPFYLGVPKNYPEHTDTPAEIIISGNKAAVYIDFKGKTPDGQPAAFKASDWFEIENGKIKSLHVFFDSFALYSRRKKS